jgi:hypothetical protein
MGFKLDPDTPAMQRELTYLLYDLCVKWGFCIPPVIAEQICRTTEWDAKTFAQTIVEAEGLNPEYYPKYVRSITQKFRERFGSEEISVSTFVDRVRDRKESW